MRNFSLFFLLLLTLPIPEPAAARASPAPTPPAMKIFLARSASLDCLPGCVEWIAFEGMFDRRTPGQFRELLLRLGPKRPPILISSGGGYVAAAIEIGRLARTKGLDVVVARTEALAEDPREPGAAAPPGAAGAGNGDRPVVDYARPSVKNAFCASACTLLLAAGKRRAVGPGVRVGLHEILIPEQDVSQHVKYFQTRYWKKNGRVVSKDTRIVGERDITRHITRHNARAADYARVRGYLDEMRLPAQEIIKLMKTAAPEKMPGFHVRSWSRRRGSLQSLRRRWRFWGWSARRSKPKLLPPRSRLGATKLARAAPSRASPHAFACPRSSLRSWPWSRSPFAGRSSDPCCVCGSAPRAQSGKSRL